MLDLANIRPFGYRVLVELLDPPETNPRGMLHLPPSADTRRIAPRLARVLKLPDGRGFKCHCPGCRGLKDRLNDLTQPPPEVRMDRIVLEDIAEGDIVALQTEGGTAVDLRGSGVNLSRHGAAESPVPALLVLVHQILLVLPDHPESGVTRTRPHEGVVCLEPHLKPGQRFAIESQLARCDRIESIERPARGILREIIDECRDQADQNHCTDAAPALSAFADWIEERYPGTGFKVRGIEPKELKPHQLDQIARGDGGIVPVKYISREEFARRYPKAAYQEIAEAPVEAADSAKDWRDWRDWVLRAMQQDPHWRTGIDNPEVFTAWLTALPTSDPLTRAPAREAGHKPSPGGYVLAPQVGPGRSEDESALGAGRLRVVNRADLTDEERQALRDAGREP